jgi:hypothetical protein
VYLFLGYISWLATIANDSGRVLHISSTEQRILTQPIARTEPIPLGATLAQLYLPGSLIRLFANFTFGFTQITSHAIDWTQLYINILD